MTIMTTQRLPEVLPKHGVLYQEVAAGNALCKPKLMPLKSMTLEKLETMQKEAQDTLKEQDAQEREAERENFQEGMSDMARYSGGSQQASTGSWQLNRSKDCPWAELAGRLEHLLDNDLSKNSDKTTLFEGAAASSEKSSSQPDILSTAGDGT